MLQKAAVTVKDPTHYPAHLHAGGASLPGQQCAHCSEHSTSELQHDSTATLQQMHTAAASGNLSVENLLAQCAVTAMAKAHSSGMNLDKRELPQRNNTQWIGVQVQNTPLVVASATLAC